jgi:polyhydroxyalkanoate synthase
MRLSHFDVIDQYRLAYQRAQRYHTSNDPDMDNIAFNAECDLGYFLPTDTQVHKIFLVIPSIFNSHTILTTGKPDDMVTNLRKYGLVYIIKWNEIKRPDFDLTSYTRIVVEVIRYIQSLHNQNIELVGHCLGGIFSLAAGIISQGSINSLTLLTCPWDFAYLQNYRAFYRMLKLDEVILNQTHVPTVYLQILFFLLHPKSFDQKLDMYRAHHESMDTNFFDIEAWQFSGHPIPKSAYDQLMNQFIDDNILMRNLWYVDGIKIDPMLFRKRVLLISGTMDKIVPSCSTNTLRIALPNKVVRQYTTGHIGYLVGSSRKTFIQDLIEFTTHL